MSNFRNDYNNAVPFEKLTIRALRSYNLWDVQEGPEYVKGTHPPDLYVNGKSVDVKHDIASAKTGNVFLEEKSFYADYLVFYVDFDGSILVLRTENIKAWLAHKPAGVRYVGCAGDAKKWNGKHGGYIVPVKLLQEQAWKNITNQRWLSAYDRLCGL